MINTSKLVQTMDRFGKNVLQTAQGHAQNRIQCVQSPAFRGASALQTNQCGRMASASERRLANVAFKTMKMSLRRSWCTSNMLKLAQTMGKFGKNVVQTARGLARNLIPCVQSPVSHDASAPLTNQCGTTVSASEKRLANDGSLQACLYRAWCEGVLLPR